MWKALVEAFYVIVKTDGSSESRHVGPAGHPQQHASDEFQIVHLRQFANLQI